MVLITLLLLRGADSESGDAAGTSELIEILANDRQLLSDRDRRKMPFTLPAKER